MAEPRICSVEGCGKPVRRRVYCNAHYQKLMTYGDPLGGIRSNAAKGASMKFINEQIGVTSDECIYWPFGLSENGYGSVLWLGRNRGAHTVVCELAHGPVPDAKYEAAHSCGVRACCNPRHLRWATRADNHADKLKHGTDNRGERHKMARMTEDDVRALRAGTITPDDVVHVRGVSKNAAYMARCGASWSWLT